MGREVESRFAARRTDPVGHGATLRDTAGAGTLIGIGTGLAIGAGIVFGTILVVGTAGLAAPAVILAATATAGLGAISATTMGAAVGLQWDMADKRERGKRTSEPPSKIGSGCSSIEEGSNNVRIENEDAACVHHSNAHRGSREIASGCPTVFVNGQPLACDGDESTCGGKVISRAERTVIGRPAGGGSGAAAPAAPAPGLVESMVGSVTRLFEPDLYSAAWAGDAEATVELLNGISTATGVASAVTGMPVAGARLAAATTVSKSIGLGQATKLGAPTVATGAATGAVTGHYGGQSAATFGREHYGEKGEIFIGAFGGLATGAFGGALAGAATHAGTARIVSSRIAPRESGGHNRPRLHAAPPDEGRLPTAQSCATCSQPVASAQNLMRDASGLAPAPPGMIAQKVQQQQAEHRGDGGKGGTAGKRARKTEPEQTSVWYLNKNPKPGEVIGRGGTSTVVLDEGGRTVTKHLKREQETVLPDGEVVMRPLSAEELDAQAHVIKDGTDYLRTDPELARVIPPVEIVGPGALRQERFGGHQMDDGPHLRRAKSADIERMVEPIGPYGDRAKEMLRRPEAPMPRGFELSIDAGPQNFSVHPDRSIETWFDALHVRRTTEPFEQPAPRNAPRQSGVVPRDGALPPADAAESGSRSASGRHTPAKTLCTPTRRGDP